MQKIIIQTREGRNFLVCTDFPESKDNKGFIRVLGFKLDEYQDVSPTCLDDPDYLFNKLAKTIPHIEIKTCTNETSIIFLQRKRKPFSFRNMFGSGSKHYYEGKASNVNVRVEEIFF